MILLIWILQLATLSDLDGSDGNAYAQAYGAIEVVALWLLLAMLAIMAGE